jgi:hypothetical protein
MQGLSIKINSPASNLCLVASLTGIIGRGELSDANFSACL